MANGPFHWGAAPADAGSLLESARRCEREGRPLEAAAAYADAARAMAAQGDGFGAMAAQGRRARTLYAAGRREEALATLAEADRAAAGAGTDPRSAQARAVLDGQAAHILAAERRSTEAARRAYAAMEAFRAMRDHARAQRAAVLAARATLAAFGAKAAEPAVRELMASLSAGGGPHREVEAMLADAMAPASCGHVHDHDVLVSAPDGPAWGPLAHALACGAHLAVQNGAAWNSLSDRDHDRDHGVSLLRESWGVTDAAGWREQTEALLRGENSDPAIGLVLSLRGPAGPRADVAAWREAIVRWCRERQVKPDTVREIIELPGAILRYEERFRADGLLPRDGHVDSVLAYDFGRAVNMARWGLLAGYCDQETAESCVLRAGELSRRTYGSWIGFSAGYVLGRVLRFDEGEFGDYYDSALTGHRILAHDPAGPWRKLAWS